MAQSQNPSLPPHNPRAPARLHERNRHAGRYDFAALIDGTPELGSFLVANPYGDRSIDFADPAAVRCLNRALLKSFYGVKHWELPDGYLCPPIPGRADYVHHLADLLARDNEGAIPRGAAVRVLDIGTGASLVYPLIGHAEYGWQFLGSDIDPAALASAQAIVQANGLSDAIMLRRQKSRLHTFTSLLKEDELFDLTLCNPPFHASPEDAMSSSERKWRGLGKAGPAHKRPVRNFGGQNDEVWCKGGEAAFVRGMIQESTDLASRVLWFSTLVSKESNLPEVLHALKMARVRDSCTGDMAQGQKKSRFVAWTFQDARARQAWRRDRWGG